MNSKVAIVLLNYNGYDLTKKCMEHLRDVEDELYTLILVDNCSTLPNEVEKLKSISHLYDHFINISDCNRGFSGGMNFGAEHALQIGDFDYIIYYSNDIFPHKGFLTNLIGGMEQDPKIGLAGPVQYKYQSKAIYFAGSKITRWKNTTHHITKIEDKPQLDWINGAVFAIKRECLEESKGFDLSYYNWFEDCDLSFRAKKSGWKIAIIKEATVEHMVAQTVGGNDTDKLAHKTYYHSRNKILFVFRNKSFLEFLVFILYFLFIDTPATIFKELFPDSHAFKIVGARCRGILSAFFGSKNYLKVEKAPGDMKPDAIETKKEKKRPPARKEYFKEKIVSIWERLGSKETPCKVAIYGTGQHTIWLEEITKNLKGPKVTAIIDDSPDSSKTFWGTPPQLPSEITAEQIDFLILSTDTHQKKMTANGHKYFGDDIKILDLYKPIEISST